MYSKRGRKRNDDLPPNRARDVQRAFRARRAAHLMALEQRVTELEAENDYFRQTLNLPPANRPSLGRGPTGKDKPKLLHSESSSVPPSVHRSGSDSLDSPGSRCGSNSPVLHPAELSPPRPMTLISDDSAPPERRDPSDQCSTSASSPTYEISPIAIPVQTHKVENDTYASPTGSSGYPHTSDPPKHDAYAGKPYPVQIDLRSAEQQPRTHYSYLSQIDHPSQPQNYMGQTLHHDPSPIIHQLAQSHRHILSTISQPLPQAPHPPLAPQHPQHPQIFHPSMQSGSRQQTAHNPHQPPRQYREHYDLVNPRGHMEPRAFSGAQLATDDLHPQPFGNMRLDGTFPRQELYSADGRVYDMV